MYIISIYIYTYIILYIYKYYIYRIKTLFFRKDKVQLGQCMRDDLACIYFRI